MSGLLDLEEGVARSSGAGARVSPWSHLSSCLSASRGSTGSGEPAGADGNGIQRMLKQWDPTNQKDAMQPGHRHAGAQQPSSRPEQSPWLAGSKGELSNSMPCDNSRAPLMPSQSGHHPFSELSFHQGTGLGLPDEVSALPGCRRRSTEELLELQWHQEQFTKLMLRVLGGIYAFLSLLYLALEISSSFPQNGVGFRKESILVFGPRILEALLLGGLVDFLSSAILQCTGREIGLSGRQASRNYQHAIVGVVPGLRLLALLNFFVCCLSSLSLVSKLSAFEDHNKMVRAYSGTVCGSEQYLDPGGFFEFYLSAIVLGSFIVLQRRTVRGSVGIVMVVAGLLACFLQVLGGIVLCSDATARSYSRASFTLFGVGFAFRSVCCFLCLRALQEDQCQRQKHDLYKRIKLQTTSSPPKPATTEILSECGGQDEALSIRCPSEDILARTSAEFSAHGESDTEADLTSTLQITEKVERHRFVALPNDSPLPVNPEESPQGSPNHKVNVSLNASLEFQDEVASTLREQVVAGKSARELHDCLLAYLSPIVHRGLEAVKEAAESSCESSGPADVVQLSSMSIRPPSPMESSSSLIQSDGVNTSSPLPGPYTVLRPPRPERRDRPSPLSTPRGYSDLEGTTSIPPSPGTLSKSVLGDLQEVEGSETANEAGYADSDQAATSDYVKTIIGILEKQEDSEEVVLGSSTSYASNAKRMAQGHKQSSPSQGMFGSRQMGLPQSGGPSPEKLKLRISDLREDSATNDDTTAFSLSPDTGTHELSPDPSSPRIWTAESLRINENGISGDVGTGLNKLEVRTMSTGALARGLKKSGLTPRGGSRPHAPVGEVKSYETLSATESLDPQQYQREKENLAQGVDL